MDRDWIYPQSFAATARSKHASIYLQNPSTAKLAEFFDKKGLRSLKEEDRAEQWYDDWLGYQASHRLYASMLTPSPHSPAGVELNLLSYSRFLEVFAYHSPAHGYSVQCTSLGLFAILLGNNQALKDEAKAAIEAGGLLAFGVSEKDHGSDLLANEFVVSDSAPGEYLANGSKYYIGNSQHASIICILARQDDRRPAGQATRVHPVLLALRPKESKGFQGVRKIRTFGVRGGFVGEFRVKDHPFPQADVIARDHDAWDCVMGAVTLGKFFLGFGAIGICEHACQEAAAHLTRRILYGKPAIEMAHIRFAMAQAYARLTAMKLYAYRALDYLHASSAGDRRYILYCAVQKAKVCTEGVKVMAQLLECVGAKGFESDTYFEMALRDIQLLPGLEGSTHVNLALTAQFIPRYFARPENLPAAPKSLAITEDSAGEIFRMTRGRSGAIRTISFDHYLSAYRPLRAIANVRLFARQAKAFQLFFRRQYSDRKAEPNLQANLLMGQCLATIAYGQLMAENALRFDLPAQVTSAIFHLLANDLTLAAITVASSGQFDAASIAALMRRTAVVPRTAAGDWDFISARAGSI
ncbi:MAG TPA: acyl-CoA dehydrogenase [Tepidisphaeraceae bacterium]|nr:acyl-CoA dehydrogenase [Tepidisphaeraceae bacterium]